MMMSGFMRHAALALTVLAAGTSVAAARPDLRQMTCAEAQQTVLRNGAVVFTTGPYTYDRFVANHSYCDRWEEAVPVTAATRDTPQCPVAYKCQEPAFNNRFGWDD
ncbi:MAG: hypothetical protein C0457_04095 [Polymorphum sp.]|uniref:Uncharacterized protein n=2 Tax=Stappiaceae TaxID=2821832 RepID=A0A0U3EFI8_9HYPH|nr:hypothetical protein APZ00_21325 [Pannonibacter phragmitetus]MBA4204151.1 hypothetical protein [Polymorphum sp.]